MADLPDDEPPPNSTKNPSTIMASNAVVPTPAPDTASEHINLRVLAQVTQAPFLANTSSFGVTPLPPPNTSAGFQ